MATATPAIPYSATSGAATGGSISVFWTMGEDELPSAGNGTIVAGMLGADGPCLLAAVNSPAVDPADFQEYYGSGNAPAAAGTFSATISSAQLASGQFACTASTPQILSWSPGLHWSAP
jgi:hypothetical protein